MKAVILLGSVVLLALGAGCAKDGDSSRSGDAGAAGAASGGSSASAGAGEGDGGTTARGGSSGSAGAGEGDGGTTARGGSSGEGDGGTTARGGSAGAGNGGTTARGGSSGKGGVPASGGSSGSAGEGDAGATTESGGTAGAESGRGGSDASGGGGSETGGDGGGGAAGSSGFDIRIPSTHTLDCSSEAEPALGGPQEFMDTDYVCTFADGDIIGQIYVQATPVSCIVMMSAQPKFDVTAQIMIDGVIESVAGATYDYGGNHNNDSLQFEYGGKTYYYYHSSFGFGWRRCQPMDCAQITDGDVTDDGCTCERKHPVVCAPILEDGTHDSIEVDNFAVCLGDSTCGE